MDNINIFLINSSLTIMEALKQLDAAGRQILFVVNDGKLVGSLSDGDVRRWILKGGDLSALVSKVMKKTPYTITKEQLPLSRRIMDEKMINALPVVDFSGKIIDIVFKEKNSAVYDKINLPIVIMAGGKGTRLYPYTKVLPKPLIPIGDIPISEHIVNQFCGYGCNDFYFVVNYKKNMIKAYFNEIERNYNVIYVEEEEPLGTGGGISLLRNRICSTFILTNCDSIIREDYSKIINEHRKKKNLVTMICSLRNYTVPYGVVEIDESYNIRSMREKPNVSYFTNTGTYIVEPEVIDLIEPGIKIDFPDIIQKLCDAGENVGVYPIDENLWLDMGQFDSMDEMKKRLNIED